jgi:hypothetical protein
VEVEEEEPCCSIFTSLMLDQSTGRRISRAMLYGNFLGGYPRLRLEWSARWILVRGRVVSAGLDYFPEHPTAYSKNDKEWPNSKR